MKQKETINHVNLGVTPDYVIDMVIDKLKQANRELDLGNEKQTIKLMKSARDILNSVDLEDNDKGENKTIDKETEKILHQINKYRRMDKGNETK